MAGQVRRDERVNSAAARPDRAPDIRLVARPFGVETCVYRKLNPDVLVMESAEDRA